MHCARSVSNRPRPSAGADSRAVKRLLLIGGGHAHLAALSVLSGGRSAGLLPILIAPSPRLLYSGMMPSWIAGQSRFDDCVIDLARICKRSDIAWVEDEITQIDFFNRIAHGRRARHEFDLVSLNVGSAVSLGTQVRVESLVLGAKPFSDFIQRWERWRAQALRQARAHRLLVVGGGAAGVEIAFALAAMVRREPAFAGSSVTLATQAPLLPNMAPLARALARGSLTVAGVALEEGLRYVGCEAKEALFSDGQAIEADLVILATGATPPGWLSDSARRAGFLVTPQGALQVGADLRVSGASDAFAAGDCAQIVGQDLPRSGVHALRQGSVLGHNLLALGRGAQSGLASYHGRRQTLALLNRCDGSAIAAWGRLAFAGRAAWQWKRWIDTRFVAGFR